MPIEQTCSTCDQLLPAKYHVWQVVTQHLEGCTVNFIVQISGFSKFVVRTWLNELFVEDKVYKKRGKWYPEMAVSWGHHFH